MPPAATTVQHRAELDSVSTIVSSEAAGLVQDPDFDNIDRWWNGRADQLTDTVIDGFDVTADLGVRYLNNHAELAGTTISPVRATPVADRIREGLRITGPVAFKTNLARTGSLDSARRTMIDRTRAASTRLTLLGSRETVITTIAESEVITGFRRIAQPGACDFCQMLEGRGAVFKSARTASEVIGSGGRPRGNQRIGRSYHDSCRCVVEPIMDITDLTQVQRRELSQANRSPAARLEQAAAQAGRLRRRGAVQRAKREAEQLRQAKALDEARSRAVGTGQVDPDVLARWDVSEDQLLNARAMVTDIKRDIRATAAREADDIGTWLHDNDLAQLARPERLQRSTDVFGSTRSVRTQSGYDFLEGLDDAETARVRARMVDSDLFAPDLIAEQVRRKTQQDLSDGEAMDWLVERWLHEDGLRSLASGRIPKYADADNLIPGDYALDGYQIERLFGVDLDDAAGHVAQVQQGAARQYAERTLGNPTNGPAPWEMDVSDYLREIEDVEDILATTVISPGVDPGETYRAAQRRIRELAPPDIDIEGNMSPVELFEAIRLVAQTAGRI